MLEKSIRDELLQELDEFQENLMHTATKLSKLMHTATKLSKHTNFAHERRALKMMIEASTALELAIFELVNTPVEPDLNIPQ